VTCRCSVAVLWIPVSVQIFSRHTPFVAASIRTEEAARFRFIWTMMIGAIMAVEDPVLSAARLDQALRDGDSSQVCERLKEPNIPFVIYSGTGQPDGACGDALHVSQPARAAVLVATVLGLLQRPPTGHLRM
jgi:hypothetical protein